MRAEGTSAKNSVNPIITDEIKREYNMKNITKLRNINPESSYVLNCCMCGTAENVHLTAHRNEEGNIVGFVVGCKKCFDGEQELCVSLRVQQSL